MSFHSGEEKGWWRSRTVWVGLIAVVFAALSAFGVVPPFGEDMVAEAIMGIVGILAVVFRVDADKAISSAIIPHAEHSD